MPDLEHRIAKIEAIQAIQALKARYADACDNQYDPQRMREEIFTSDAVWHADPFGHVRGNRCDLRVFRRCLERDHVGAALPDCP